MNKCFKCSTELPDKANFCSNCGFPIGTIRVCRSCSQCGASLSAVDRYCSQCGKPVIVVKSTNDNPFLVTKSAVQNGNIPRMIPIEGGEFLFGGAQARCSVSLSNFVLSETPVTQRQYLYVMGNNPSKLRGDEKPVEMVNWCEAIIFCNMLSVMQGFSPCYSIGSVSDLRTFDAASPVWKRVSCNFMASGYRLPTEAEWEYAARGGKKCDSYKYAGSSDISQVAWYGENSDITTHVVGTKSPNSLGLYDMCGNVMEWCWDYYANEIPDANLTNPHGPQIGNLHVKRGGSWLDDEQQCTVFFRSGSASAGKSSSLGFRVCRTEFGDKIESKHS